MHYTDRTGGRAPGRVCRGHNQADVGLSFSERRALGKEIRVAGRWFPVAADHPAISNAMPRRGDDPLGNFRFSLELDQVRVAGFAECSGLQMETKVLEYKEGGNNSTTLKFPEGSSYGNITLK